MEAKYRLDSASDLEELSKVLNPYGIYLQRDLFGQLYICIDYTILNHCRPGSRKMNPAPDRETVEQVMALRSNGITIRKIAEVTGYSTGMICKILQSAKSE